MNNIPTQFRNRNLYHHNPQMTLLRTSAAKCHQIDQQIEHKLNTCHGPIRFLIPELDISTIDAPEQPFYDPTTDTTLFAALEDTILHTAQRRLIHLPLHIDDPRFTLALIQSFREITP